MDWRVLQARHEAILADERWMRVSDEGGVRGAMMVDPESGVPMARCTTSLGCAPEVLVRFLVEDLVETLPEWNPVAAGGEILEQRGTQARVVRLLNRLPWPLRVREDVFFNAWQRLDDGVWVELSTSVEHPAAPRGSTSVRSQMHFAGKRMAPRSDGGCDYTAIWHYDLRGVLGRIAPRRMLGRAILRDLAGELARLRERFGVPG